MVLSHVYSGSLVSYLTVESDPAFVSTVDELERGEWDIHVFGQEMRKQFVGYPGLFGRYMAVEDLGETFEAVRAGKAAFMDSKVALEYRIRQNFTDRWELI